MNPVKSESYKHPSRRKRTRQVVGLFGRAARHKVRGRNKEMLITIADGFLELGGIYVKFLQGTLLQHPLMKEWRRDDHYKIFENLEPQPLNIDSVLQHQLHSNFTKLASLDRQPFAAGSFGQSYHATLHDGTHVVVKVLRPHSRSTLAHDLRLLRGVSKLMASTFTSWDIDFKNLVQDFTKATFTETDYGREKNFAIKLYDDFQDQNHIMIPKTYEDLCSANVITQEYVSGISGVDLMLVHDRGEDVAQYVRQQIGSDVDLQLEMLGHSLLINVFRGKAIHGDPHPGNLRFMPDNKVGLIDFGIAANPPRYRAAFYQLMKQYWLAESQGRPDPGAIFRYNIKYYANDLYMSLQKISSFLSMRYHQNVDINKIIEELALSIFKEKMGGIETDQMSKHMQSGGGVNNVINDRNRFGLVGKMQDADMMRSWLTYNNFLKSIGKRQLISRIYDRIMTQVEKEMPELESDEPPHISLATAVDIMSSWLERVAQRDPMLFRQLMSQLHFKDLMALENSAETPPPLT